MKLVDGKHYVNVYMAEMDLIISNLLTFLNWLINSANTQLINDANTR